MFFGVFSQYGELLISLDIGEIEKNAEKCKENLKVKKTIYFLLKELEKSKKQVLFKGLVSKFFLLVRNKTSSFKASLYFDTLSQTVPQKIKIIFMHEVLYSNHLIIHRVLLT